MFKYVAMIAGVLIMCVPDDASVLRFILQGGLGLILFGIGVALSIEESNH